MFPIPFSNSYTYPGHSGVDFPQPRGTPFRASGPGTVTSIDYGPRPGHTVWVRYDGTTVFHVGPLVGYCHMDYRTTDVYVGQRVAEGTILGRVGSLGQFSTGPHLHVEISGYATTAGFWRFFTASRVVSASGGGAGGGGTPIGKDWFTMATEADLRRILRQELAPIALASSGTNRFFKHGGMPSKTPLWIYVMENGDFVRIRDLGTARLYKERNGGRQATLLTSEAIRLLVSDLIESGGRDLSVDEDGRITATDPDQAVADAMQVPDADADA